MTQLHKYSAPAEILVSYLELIENLETRMETAKRVQCHRAVIDVSIGLLKPVTHRICS